MQHDDAYRLISDVVNLEGRVTAAQNSVWSTGLKAAGLREKAEAEETAAAAEYDRQVARLEAAIRAAQEVPDDLAAELNAEIRRRLIDRPNTVIATAHPYS